MSSAPNNHEAHDYAERIRAQLLRRLHGPTTGWHVELLNASRLVLPTCRRG